LGADTPAFFSNFTDQAADGSCFRLQNVNNGRNQCQIKCITIPQRCQISKVLNKFRHISRVSNSLPEASMLAKLLQSGRKTSLCEFFTNLSVVIQEVELQFGESRLLCSRPSAISLEIALAGSWTL
jgi:hypothetical protein